MKIPRLLLLLYHVSVKLVYFVRNKLVYLLLVLSILLPIVGLKTGLLKFPTVLRVTEIECKTQYGLCTTGEQQQLEDILGQDFLLLDSAFIAAKLTERDFKNRRVFVEKVFPGKLTVILEKRKPIVALRSEASGSKTLAKGESRMFLVDQEGVVVDFVKTSILPHLVLEENVSLVVGENVPGEVLHSTQILYLMNKSQGANIAYFEQGQVSVQLPGDIIVYFAPTGDLEARVGALQLIMSRIRMDGKLPKTIDLRYSKPVLHY